MSNILKCTQRGHVTILKFLDHLQCTVHSQCHKLKICVLYDTLLEHANVT